MAHAGQGDGGAYFSVLSPASYGVGSAQYEEALILGNSLSRLPIVLLIRALPIGLLWG